MTYALSRGDEPNIAYNDGPVVMLIRQEPASDRLEAAALAIGGRVTPHFLDAFDPGSRADPACDIIAVEADGVAMDRLAATLPAIGDMARMHDVRLVVAFDDDAIDVVAGIIDPEGATLLCGPTIGECVSAFAIAAEAARRPIGLFDVTRENEAARLHRLNVEVARIAETLARLTRAEQAPVPSTTSTVGDRMTTFEAAPTVRGDGVDGSAVRRIIRARRLRDQFFGTGLFEDPAWDMLLDLFAAELERAQVSVSSLCIAAAVAPTTALRWIGKMTEVGLFERRPDPFDRRRAFMALSATASLGMRDYMTATARYGLGIV